MASASIDGYMTPAADENSSSGMQLVHIYSNLELGILTDIYEHKSLCQIIYQRSAR